MLPHVDGHPGEVATYFSAGRHGSAARELTDAEKLAGWNQRFVEEDGSHGVHNFPYAQKLLVDAIRAMSPETPGSAMAGDFNGDNQVNFNDLFMFVSEFGKSEASAGWDAQFDLSGNGVVGFTDWVMFLDTFGQASASSKPVLVDNGRNRQFTFDLVGSNRSSIDRDHLGVTLTANHLTEMRGYGVYVSYDPAVLEFVRAVRADDGLMPVGDKTSVLSVRETEPGRVMISDAVVGNRPVGGSGQLADLIFRRLGPASANSVQIDLAQVADLTYGINRPSHAVEPAGKTALIYTLGQNFPNPFNPATTIHFSLADPGEVKIVVYNALGQAVRTLVENYRLAGDYSAIWDARDYSGREVASGVYVYQMEINGFSATQRMVLMR
jgi:hypothetical protein